MERATYSRRKDTDGRLVGGSLPDHRRNNLSLPQRDAVGRFLPADSELAVIATIQRTLKSFDDETRARILRWMWARFVVDRER